MIEEHAQVVALDGEFAWVEAQRRSSCGTCTSEKGCGTAAMGKLRNVRSPQMRVRNSLGLSIGEGVVIGLHEGALVRSSLVVYLLPLFVMFASALLIRGFGGGEGSSALAGIAGLALGFWGVRTFSRRASVNTFYHAVILRRASGLPTIMPLQYIK